MIAQPNWSPTSSVTTIAVHHSVTRRLESNSETVRRIHIEEFEWDDAGYHYAIERGRVRLLRPLWRRGANVKNHNSSTIGVCLIGDYRDTHDGDPRGDPDDPRWAWRQLVMLCADLLDQFDLSTEALRGHGELTATACPGFDPELLRGYVLLERKRRRRDVPGLYPYTEQT